MQLFKEMLSIEYFDNVYRIQRLNCILAIDNSYKMTILNELLSIQGTELQLWT